MNLYEKSPLRKQKSKGAGHGELNKDKVRGNYIMDCLDIAEKALQKKAAAKADTEQPGKEVKNNGENRGKWNGPNYARALINSGLSGEARILADHVYTNQGKAFKFHERKLLNDTGLSRVKLYRAMAELEEVNAIERDRIRNGAHWGKGVFMKWNFDYQTWKRKNDSYQNDNYQNDNYQNDNYQSDNYQNDNDQNDHCINIDKKDLISPPGNSEHSSNDLTSLNSEHEEKREGAAAKPQPAPPPGTASKGSSFPETAQGQQNGNKYQIPLTVPEVMKQGQTDLFGVPERVPEKPKKGSKGKSKGKPKAAEEIEIPTLEQVTEYITGYITENNAIEFWTVYEIQLTAKAILEYHINTGHWKDWQQGARNWIRRSKQGAFRPEVVDPARFEKGNQPGRARGQVTTAARIMEMAGNTDPQRALEQRREQEIQKGGVIIQD